MSYNFPPTLQQLVDQNLATGIYKSEEHLLETALCVLSDYRATVADIRQGMEDYEQGRFKPLEQAVADVRRQLGNAP